MTDINIDTKLEEKNQEELLPEIEEMYRAGVHFGYSRSSCHSKMVPYLFGVKNNTEIFNLEKTHSCLNDAMEFLKQVAGRGGKLLLVATKPEAKDLIEKAGRELEMPYVIERWLGGTLTNFEEIKKRVSYLKDLRLKKTAGEFSRLIKKEAVLLDKKMMRMDMRLNGLENLMEKPAVLLVVDPKNEKAAVFEAKKIGVPVVAILNSDCNPAFIDYVVPGNDVAVRSIKYLLDKLIGAYKDGLNIKKEI